MSDDLDPVWRALASPLRRRLLDELRARPRSTGDLATVFPDLSRFAVMQHLGVLVDAGLVVVRRDGRTRWNHLNPVPIQRIHERWVSRYDAPFAADLTALKRRVESPPPAEPASRRRRRPPVKEPVR